MCNKKQVNVLYFKLFKWRKINLSAIKMDRRKRAISEGVVRKDKVRCASAGERVL